MNTTEKIKLLTTKYKLNPMIARAYLESEGKCVFCGEELLDNLLGYLCCDTVRLLPQSEYPYIADNVENWVLCCPFCKAVKSRLEIDLNWDKRKKLSKHKEELINIFKQSMESKRKQMVKEISEIKEIVKSL